MANITTCTRCGNAYEAGSEEQANEPAGEDGRGRLCFTCRLPYPWCIGAPTKADCIKIGYCTRKPSCGD